MFEIINCFCYFYKMKLEIWLDMQSGCSDLKSFFYHSLQWIIVTCVMCACVRWNLANRIFSSVCLVNVNAKKKIRAISQTTIN